MKGVDGEHCVRPRVGRKLGIVELTEHRFDDVVQSLALDAPADCLDHETLNVHRVDSAVRADTTRQPHREPPAARAEIDDRRALRHVQCVHHLIGFLPCLAVRRLEQPEILRSEQPRIASLGFARLLLKGRPEGRHYER